MIAVVTSAMSGYTIVNVKINKRKRGMDMERIEAAEELLEDMKECFLNGTSLVIKANDFNIVSWLIEEVKRKTK